MGNKKTIFSPTNASPIELKSRPSLYIEDLPTVDLKLFFKGFQEIYKEFIVLQEMTTTVLEGMGIFLK